jgi:hypothetical protein
MSQLPAQFKINAAGFSTNPRQDQLSSSPVSFFLYFLQGYTVRILTNFIYFKINDYISF